MDYTNRGSSPYHEACGLWIRDFGGNSIHVTGKDANKINSNWPIMRRELKEHETCKPTVLQSGTLFSAFELPLETFGATFLGNATVHPLVTDRACSNHNVVVRVQECIRPGCSYVVGMCSICNPATSEELQFRDWFRMLVLAETRLNPPPPDLLVDVDVAVEHADQITSTFDAELRNVSLTDEWDSGGRDVFQNGVQYFTARQAPIEFALPAFPCKSTNPHKTNGILPDRAEEMALIRLHDFCHTVEKMYEPGAKILIISDGHVFADCSKSDHVS